MEKIKMDQAFEAWRQITYGVHHAYPVDAYTAFGAGFDAACVLIESKDDLENEK